jgi:hypothetical protein
MPCVQKETKPLSWAAGSLSMTKNTGIHWMVLSAPR